MHRKWVKTMGQVGKIQDGSTTDPGLTIARKYVGTVPTYELISGFWCTTILTCGQASDHATCIAATYSRYMQVAYGPHLLG